MQGKNSDAVARHERSKYNHFIRKEKSKLKSKSEKQNKSRHAIHVSMMNDVR